MRWATKKESFLEKLMYNTRYRKAKEMSTLGVEHLEQFLKQKKEERERKQIS
ncbi:MULTISPECIES: hypothetical protein [Geobacillus]|uniref:hypothetical protein n=1 Tax=Geobacillus TaxID=129337 RepID=UPI0014854886|nr:hypothetical protein [Geobacillus thermoleovorans]MBW7642896.1 hypothetical protein [Geobacillus thermoleovorans]